MNNLTISDAEKISLLRDATIALSVSQAQFINQQLIQDMKRFKLNLLVMKINRGFETLGYKDFKSYVLAELAVTYDAVIKQMMAANTAIKLFGPEKVGYYSDSSMITLGAINFELQIKVIIELKAMFKKEIDVDLSPKELTKKNVDLVLSEFAPNVLKVVNATLSEENKSEDYCRHDFHLSSDLFQIADEAEFKAKHGFSRWDPRSLKLLKTDELAGMSSDELQDTLSLKWSIHEMLVHVKTYHEASLKDAMIDAEAFGHAGLVSFVIALYHQDAEDEKENEQYTSVLESDFFSDAEDDSTKSKYKKMRSKLRKTFFRTVDEEYTAKNPKAAILMVIAENLSPQELRLAAQYFEEIYSELDYEDEDLEDVCENGEISNEDDDDDFSDNAGYFFGEDEEFSSPQEE